MVYCFQNGVNLRRVGILSIVQYIREEISEGVHLQNSMIPEIRREEQIDAGIEAAKEPARPLARSHGCLPAFRADACLEASDIATLVEQVQVCQGSMAHAHYRVLCFPCDDNDAQIEAVLVIARFG